MITEKDTVLVGVSGGIDSITLLYSLFFLKDDLKCSLVAAHANHGLRGEQSDKEAEFVRKIADELKLPSVIEKIDVLGYMTEKGLSKQAAARELRYDFFERTAKKTSANKIALGHNANDQAETVLIRLLRGSGAKGIAGIKPVRACSERSESNKIIRPLIEIRRDEITEFVKEKRLKYVEDPSNLEPYYLRNKIRLELIPLLKKEYNPNIIETLREAAEIVGDEDEFLESYCSTIMSAIGSPNGSGFIEIDVLKLKNFHIAIKRRIIRIALKMIKGDLLKISAVHVEDILNSINKGFSGKSLNLPDGICVLYEYDKLKLFREVEVAEEAEVRFDIPLKIPGETILSKPEYKFIAEIISPVDFVAAGFSLRNKYISFFDMDKIKGALRVRNRVNGDIFHPSGMKGSKKLKEFFIDEKIPRRERDSIPLIVSGDIILWIVGKRVADYGKVDKDTKNILKIEAIKGN
ncbi:MAG: tRNA lysidine(34) synthetase TilS [Nitrospinae bacterium]|nr:tRNA lysidine(34) synthetase TilS [Nitrospinota bacterium]